MVNFDWRAFLKVVEMVAPPSLAALGVPPVLIPIVTHGIVLAETTAAESPDDKTGAEKKAIAMDATMTGIAAVNAIKPGLLDPAIADLVSDGIDTTVNALKIIARGTAIGFGADPMPA